VLDKSRGQQQAVVNRQHELAVEQARQRLEAEKQRLASEVEQARQRAEAEKKQLELDMQRARQQTAEEEKQRRELELQQEQQRWVEEELDREQQRQAEAEKQRLASEVEQARQWAEAEKKQLELDMQRARQQVAEEEKKRRELELQQEQQRCRNREQHRWAEAEKQRLAAEVEQARQRAEAEKKQLELDMQRARQQVAKAEKQRRKLEFQQEQQRLLEEERNREQQRQAEAERQRRAEVDRQGDKAEKQQRESATKQGKLFQFETVLLNAQGKIFERRPGQARQQVQDLGKGVTLEMVYIPGGTFLMGSPASELERQASESPQHQVKIEPFFLSKYLITQAQWEAVMGNNPSHFKDPKRPVEWVTWDDTVAFCQKLSQQTGRTYQLPSEAQWEYACRAGTTTPFYFGETISMGVANYDGEGKSYGAGPKGMKRGQTTDVGSFPPNTFGLYDMLGNTWEWCADPWHGSYQGAPGEGQIWEKGGEKNRFVLRGGSWYNDPCWCRCASRIRSNGRAYRLYYRSFRVCGVSVWT